MLEIYVDTTNNIHILFYLVLNIYIFIFFITFRRILQAFYVEWRSSTPHNASTQELRNENTKYYVSSYGTRTYNLSQLQPSKLSQYIKSELNLSLIVALNETVKKNKFYYNILQYKTTKIKQ